MKKAIFSLKKLLLFSIIITIFFSNNISLYNSESINHNKDILVSQTDTPNIETNTGLNIHFYPLAGGKNDKDPIRQASSEGDSYIITIGDIEILVDAGATEGSNHAILSQMKKYISKDNIWDYIIATHADYDHISAFVSNEGKDGIFSWFLNTNNNVKLKTIIDFDITQDETVTYPQKGKLFTGKTYALYKTCRAQLINQGTTYYTSSQCCWEQRNIKKDKMPEGATNRFQLADNVTLNILYNYYNDHKFNESIAINSADKNNLSVCFTIEYINSTGQLKQFLFTGDLEEINSADHQLVYGETRLIQENPQLEQGVLFYKVAHHGSSTSSSEQFIDTIKPAYAVIPAIAGNDSYSHEPNSESSFPSSVVMDRLFKYTDRIYIPAYADYSDKEKVIKDYYGNIDISYNDEISITTSCLNELDDSDDGMPLPIQNTDWFTQYRKEFLSCYTFTTTTSQDNSYVGSCSLIKYGHYDILIDAGFWCLEGKSALSSTYFTDKIKSYCVDDVIECLIVTAPNSDSIQQLVDYTQYDDIISKGIMSEFKIERIIDFGLTPDPSQDCEQSLYEKYEIRKKQLIQQGTQYISAYDAIKQQDTINITNNLCIKILNNEYYNEQYNSNVCVLIDFYGEQLLFTGNLNNEGAQSIAKLNNFENVVYYKIPDYGYEDAIETMLLEKISYSDNNLFIVGQCVAGIHLSGKQSLTLEVLDTLLAYTDHVYITSTRNSDGKNENLCGDITFKIIVQNNTVLRKSLRGSNNTNPIDKTNYYKELYDNKIL